MQVMQKSTVIVMALTLWGFGGSLAWTKPDKSNVDGAASTQTPSPSVHYKSPFSDYRPLGEDKRTPWKAANDEVAKIGGWRVYAREAAGDASRVEEATGAPSPAAGRASPTTPNAPNAPNAAPVLAPQPASPVPSPALPAPLRAPSADVKHAGHNGNHSPETKK